ncbi:hypothetical protein M501DRAFT_995533 [Patellaria atrata CBS 101060]|uniref:Pre-rRNA-processing protein TSR2 n=1 Tax=Patellaria atrata CBS 101060 TaxID=1346257 RepID=A0A9P4S7X6_9PEZI|nr:hypothetical protein M501DRAFT_995533 [Patellaria atrata CBS 101060]
MTSQTESQILPPVTKTQVPSLDLAIALSLSRWPALTLAVQNQWGGPDSADKRDWLAGALSELIVTKPDTDAEDIEDVLLQVMGDEFDISLEDESEVEVAKTIMRLRKGISEGDLKELGEMRREWEERKGRPVGVGHIEAVEHNHGGELDSVDEESGSEDDDEDRMEGVVQAPPKEKPKPEVDEDGFTTVVSKKRR